MKAKIIYSMALVCLVWIIAPLSAQAAATSDAFSTTFFPVLPVLASPETEPVFVPMSSNHALAGNHKNITRAIIAVHDFSRDPREILGDLISLAGADNASTLIVAPQFLIESDIARTVDNLPDDGKHVASWTAEGWALGDDSIASPQRKPVSSFNVMDLLLMYLGDTSAFPDVKQIIVVGNGEGARFTQIYSAVGKAIDILQQQHLRVSFLVMNAPSYLYFTPLRFTGGKQGLGLPDTAACAAYNAWPYGLEGLNPYARHVGVNAIKQNYARRMMIYLTGKSLARNDPAPDTNCAALAQGKTRVERTDNYRLYLNNVFGEQVRNTQAFNIIAKTGYNERALLASACGVEIAFGDGYCPNALEQ